MIYIVSGASLRIGSSMMMHALACGGMECVYNDRDSEARRKSFSDPDYNANIDGLYELSRPQMTEWWFPQMYPGKLVKILVGGIPGIAAGEHPYKIVWMDRHPEESLQSAEAMLNAKPPGMATAENIDYLRDRTIAIMERRDDIEFTRLHYRNDVMADPIGSFDRLADVGWPIDPLKAASIVDPSRCRYKVENLEVGICG